MLPTLKNPRTAMATDRNMAMGMEINMAMGMVMKKRKRVEITEVMLNYILL